MNVNHDAPIRAPYLTQTGFLKSWFAVKSVLSPSRSLPVQKAKHEVNGKETLITLWLHTHAPKEMNFDNFDIQQCHLIFSRLEKLGSD